MHCGGWQSNGSMIREKEGGPMEKEVEEEKVEVEAQEAVELEVEEEVEQL